MGENVFNLLRNGSIDFFVSSQHYLYHGKVFLTKTISDPDALKTNVLTKSSGKAFKNKTKEF